MDGRAAHVGAAGAPDGEATSSSWPSTSSSLSLSSSGDDQHDDALPDARGFFVDGAGASTGSGVKAQLRRLWAAARAGAPRLQEACEDAAGDVAAWTGRGGALRALLVVSVGSASLAALSGLLLVAFFVAAAATTAVVSSLVASLVAAGGFLAVLLAVLASTYVGALSVAVFVIATTSAATVTLITIATGWVAFFWILWFVAAKCVDLLVATKGSINTANSVM